MSISKRGGFVIRLDKEFITVEFKHDPRCDTQGQKIVAMLEKSGFTIKHREPTASESEVITALSREGVAAVSKQTTWARSRTDFWVEQCHKLAQRFGVDVLETPPIMDASETLHQFRKTPEPEPDPIAELKKQILAMQQEMSKLKQEVEELKKLEPSDG